MSIPLSEQTDKAIASLTDREFEVMRLRFKDEPEMLVRIEASRIRSKRPSYPYICVECSRRISDSGCLHKEGCTNAEPR